MFRTRNPEQYVRIHWTEPANHNQGTTKEAFPFVFAERLALAMRSEYGAEKRVFLQYKDGSQEEV